MVVRHSRSGTRPGTSATCIRTTCIAVEAVLGLARPPVRTLPKAAVEAGFGLAAVQATAAGTGVPGSGLGTTEAAMHAAGGDQRRAGRTSCHWTRGCHVRLLANLKRRSPRRSAQRAAPRLGRLTACGPSSRSTSRPSRAAGAAWVPSQSALRARLTFRSISAAQATQAKTAVSPNMRTSS